MDDLKTIKGIGKATEKQLHAAGVTSFAQLAGADAAALRLKAGFKAIHDVEGWIAAAAVGAAASSPPASRSAGKPATGAAAVSVVLLADGEHGRKGETVSIPGDQARALRSAKAARRMTLADLKR
ncbi:MAG TPA: helix-hairpin-helix domain-containing protein [Devosiaceae bacterium]|jgi:hypothetical protein|nr:helix-hairpin-helix domain-containing protein [Devosiaceae bacterium]